MRSIHRLFRAPALSASAAVLFAIACASPAAGQSILLFQFDGPSAGDHAGISVAGVGDLDGDGRGDILVGEPWADPSAIPDAGRATLLSGATGAVIFAINGTEPNASLGQAVAGVADANADGVADLLVASPTATVGGFPGVGRVRIFSGTGSGSFLTVDGAAAGDNLGWSVAPLGDLNGDGVPDFVAGAPFSDPAGQSNGGIALALSGASGGTLFPVTGTAFDHVGWSVGGVFSVDGDAVGDVLVGAIGADPGGVTNAGEVRVLAGATGALLFTITGTASKERVGASVAGAGDLNGDGTPDILVGADGAAAPGVAGAGRVRACSGLGGGILYSVFGASVDDHLGYSLAAVGDVNGDGVSDWVAGAPGIPNFVLGSGFGAGSVRLASGSNGATIASAVGSATDDNFGAAVAAAGDANGDGVLDFVAGAPKTTLATPAAGYARVLSAVGFPAGVTEVGAGCVGAGGFAPVLKAFGGAPTLGNAAFGISLSRGPGGAPGFLFYGSLVFPAGLPIYGCNAHVAGLTILLPPSTTLSGPAGVPGIGHRFRPLPIPFDPVLLGATVPLQMTVFDPGSPNGLFTTTNAMTLVVS